ncbi:WD40/YVTN repeat-like-containing domain [Lasallia pustulata]|uniref:ASTRA-associated protein 1 n=1 Tax=Lasallia pustulata TaxID=136370 RepID=A0A1W5DB25_9LECA|nr:WD40/YVTN repeat-like-containing domain [Lasallia pustulata]
MSTANEGGSLSLTKDRLPPAQPAYVLRGHAAQVHALHFTPDNTRLLTADADGWVISWNVALKRSVAVWRAHGAAILGLGTWGQDRVVTHGRDNKLAVWQLSVADEDVMDKTLPVNCTSPFPTPKDPWLLHSLTVNTLNFCSFAMCYDTLSASLETNDRARPVLFAIPNTMDSGGIDIFQLPSEKRVSVIQAEKNTNTGMVMALGIVAEGSRMLITAGYESGHTMVFAQGDPGAPWQPVYVAQPHTQPVLSLATSPLQDYYITSSADAVIAKHPLPSASSMWTTGVKPLKVLQTKHSGRQGLRIRSDGKIFSTAGWDARIRVYSAKTMNELAVLKLGSAGSENISTLQPNNCSPADFKPDYGPTTTE